MNNLNKTLSRLASLNKNESQKTEGKKFAKFWKPKSKEKANIIFLKFPSTDDPFAFYYQHKNLFVEKGRTIPCKKHNKNESCVFCDLVKELQSEDWKGNFPLWKPLEVDIRVYSPIVDLDNTEEGVQYWGYGSTVKNQLLNWLENLEEGEKEFYNSEELQKIVVSYDKDKEAAAMYSLDKKALKGVSEEQIEKWQSQVIEFEELVKNFYKTEEEEEILAAEYLERVKEQLEKSEVATKKPETSKIVDPEEDGEEISLKPKPSKLSMLKNK